MANKRKNWLLWFLLVFIALPFIQSYIPFINSGKLQGYYTESPDTTFSFGNWWKGTYQKGKTDFINDHIGFRPDFLRLNGQIDYSLFHKTNYGSPVVGKDNYLFYEDYIWAYYGRNFAGYPALQRQMARLKALQDTFSALGKTFILVYAPCKAWYCSDKLPPEMRSEPRPNNYKTCAHLGDSLGINQLDLNAWFLSMKDTTHELLYSRQGIHWTNYGSILGADSIVRYIERVRHIQMPHPCWTKTEHTTQPRDPDNDMDRILNLIWPIATETFCYPDLHFTQDPGITKLNAIHIGDSYNINLIRTGMIQNIYGHWQFWFSFKDIMNQQNYSEWTYPKIAGTDWKTELKNADCIVLMNTMINAHNLGNGFIDSAWNYYFQGR